MERYSHEICKKHYIFSCCSTDQVHGLMGENNLTTLSRQGLIVHSDRGSQYASHEYRKLLTQHRCVGSMSRKGDCWDNAVAESFFGSLKQEQVQWKSYQKRNEAHQDILNYISMFYNPHRLHSYLGYMSPMRFEMKMSNLKKVA